MKIWELVCISFEFFFFFSTPNLDGRIQVCDEWLNGRYHYLVMRVPRKVRFHTFCTVIFAPRDLWSSVCSGEGRRLSVRGLAEFFRWNMARHWRIEKCRWWKTILSERWHREMNEIYGRRAEVSDQGARRAPFGVDWIYWNPVVVSVHTRTLYIYVVDTIVRYDTLSVWIEGIVYYDTRDRSVWFWKRVT